MRHWYDWALDVALMVIFVVPVFGLLAVLEVLFW